MTICVFFHDATGRVLIEIHDQVHADALSAVRRSALAENRFLKLSF
jgi:hypothetical protein